MDKIRLGYVGCGFMAQKVHIPDFTSLPGCDLIALAEVRQELGRAVQSRFGIPKLYRDHQALLAAPDVEAIAVSASFMSQAEIARDALLAGKHVFMEKPMAISLKQADSMLAAAERTGARLMIAYMKRHDAGNEMAKAQIDAFRASGELGPVIYARSHDFAGDWIAGLDAPMETSGEPYPSLPPAGPDWLPPEFLGSYLAYLQELTHNVNLLRWFLGAGDNAVVRAVDLDDDGFTGVVVLAIGGVRAVIESGEISHYRWDDHTQVYFRDGWVTASSPPLLLRQVPADVEVYRAGSQQTFTRPIPKPAWSWSYKREAETFVECLLTGEAFRSPGEDARSDVRLFEEIYRAYLMQRGVL